MKKTIIENGITYELAEDGLYYPQFKFPEDVAHYGKYGMLLHTYLKEHRQALYTSLLMSGKLIKHLNEIDDTANQSLANLMERLQKSRDIDENLKARDQMAWVQAMNTAKNMADEVILSELIYN